jgi:hypothetical protein
MCVMTCPSVMTRWPYLYNDILILIIIIIFFFLFKFVAIIFSTSYF